MQGKDPFLCTLYGPTNYIPQNEGHFILEFGSKKTLNSSNSIGQKLKIGSKDFTLGLKSKKLIQVSKRCGA